MDPIRTGRLPHSKKEQARLSRYRQPSYVNQLVLSLVWRLGWYASVMITQAYAANTICYITPELPNDPITLQSCLGESGEEIVKWVDAYKFEVSCVAQNLVCCLVAICVLTRF